MRSKCRVCIRCFDRNYTKTYKTLSASTFDFCGCEYQIIIDINKKLLNNETICAIV